LFPPANSGCGGKIQEKKIQLVHYQKLQTMIEKLIFGLVTLTVDIVGWLIFGKFLVIVNSRKKSSKAVLFVVSLSILEF
jgi:hypothetical protein